VELRLNGESIRPKLADQGFEVPAAFDRPNDKWSDNQRVDISLTCNSRTLVFPHQHPAFVREGDWQFGIANPLYALSEYGYTHEFDRGAWLGYLIFEGEPGVFTLTSQPDPPMGLSDALQKERPSASPGRARDIAYVLAVFRVEYESNRDYLLSSLSGCLSRPKESPEDNVCDRDLVNFVTNLYWRGDSALLAPLLQAAEARRDVIGDIGDFYADLLDRRGPAALTALRELSTDKQQLLCSLARDDLRFDSRERERVVTFLRGARNDVANRCLQELGDN